MKGYCFVEKAWTEFVIDSEYQERNGHGILINKVAGRCATEGCNGRLSQYQSRERQQPRGDQEYDENGYTMPKVYPAIQEAMPDACPKCGNKHLQMERMGTSTWPTCWCGWEGQTMSPEGHRFMETFKFGEVSGRGEELMQSRYREHG